MTQDNRKHIETDIKAAEKELDDDAESIITNERYVYIASIIKAVLQEERTTAVCPPRIRSIRSLQTAGSGSADLRSCYVPCLLHFGYRRSVRLATDWANDGVFGDGWHLFGIGSGCSTRDVVRRDSGDAADVIDAFVTAEGADDVADADRHRERRRSTRSGGCLRWIRLQHPFLTTQQADYTLVDEETMAGRGRLTTGCKTARTRLRLL